MKTFKRLHHQAIAQVLHVLDGKLLRENSCLFGGGTVIALRYGEYRESVDIDLLVSSREGYRHLRQTAVNGLQGFFKNGSLPFEQSREVRTDQYGIRTMLNVVGNDIKFEIILEGRIELDDPGTGDEVCGIATLTPRDMVTSKLLANSDRWLDDGVFNRDLIDLAMMAPGKKLLTLSVDKAQKAYGDAILNDLSSAIDRMQQRPGWLERCMSVMDMNIPRALLWNRIRDLRKIIT